MKLLFRSVGAVFAATVLLTATWVAAQSRGREAEGHESPLEEFAVASDGDILLVPVTFEGNRHLFALDTGAVITMYDSELPLGSPKKRATIETTSDTRTVEMFDSPNASLGNLNLRAGPLVLASDLTLLRQVSGLEIRGIIGMDFLSKYVVQVDFENGRVRFFHSAPEHAGDRIPVSFQRNVPCIEAYLPSLQRRETFMIDTGSTYFGNMKQELLDVIARSGKARRIGDALTAGLSGTEADGEWLVKSISVGKFESRDVVMTQTKANLLGLGFWSRFVVTFDFPNGAMYLKKSKRPRPPNDLNMSGLHVLRIGGKTVVQSVDEGTAAARAGIKPDDVLVTVDGDRADQLSMFALRRRFCSEGKELHLTVSRAGKTIQATTILGTLMRLTSAETNPGHD